MSLVTPLHYVEIDTSHLPQEPPGYDRDAVRNAVGRASLRSGLNACQLLAVGCHAAGLDSVPADLVASIDMALNRVEYPVVSWASDHND
jgi:hypothetical protein